MSDATGPLMNLSAGLAEPGANTALANEGRSAQRRLAFPTQEFFRQGKLARSPEARLDVRRLLTALLARGQKVHGFPLTGSLGWTDIDRAAPGLFIAVGHHARLTCRSAGPKVDPWGIIEIVGLWFPGNDGDEPGPPGDSAASNADRHIKTGTYDEALAAQAKTQRRWTPYIVKSGLLSCLIGTLMAFAALPGTLSGPPRAHLAEFLARSDSVSISEILPGRSGQARAMMLIADARTECSSTPNAISRGIADITYKDETLASSVCRVLKFPPSKPRIGYGKTRQLPTTSTRNASLVTVSDTDATPIAEIGRMDVFAVKGAPVGTLVIVDVSLEAKGQEALLIHLPDDRAIRQAPSAATTASQISPKPESVSIDREQLLGAATYDHLKQYELNGEIPRY